MTTLPNGDDSDELPLGAQRPRICHVPPYVSTAGDEAIELAAMVGLHLDDWQRFVLREALGERADGKWASQTVALIVGRQNGKGAILEALELYHLFVLETELILHSAHEQKTATNHFRRLVKLIEKVPEFKRRVKAMPRGKGSEAIELWDGRMIFFATRTGGGGRGLTFGLTVYDEAMHLTEEERSALTPTRAALSMHGNTQSWYVGSAVDQQNARHDGIPFAKVREAGIAGNDQVALFEWSVPGDDPSRVPSDVAADPNMQRLANPGAGIRISYGWIELERTVEMGPRGFAVERLGIGDWPDTSEDAGRVITREQWAAIAEHDPAMRVVLKRVFALDGDPDQTRASIAGAGKRADGLFQFAVIANRSGTEWLLAACKKLKAEFPGARFAIDKRGPLKDKIDDFKRAKLRVIEVNAEEYALACSSFYSAVDEKRCRYPFPQPELDDALAGAAKAPLGDGWKWSRRNSDTDISPLVACTLALWAAERKRNPRIINLDDLED